MIIRWGRIAVALVITSYSILQIVQYKNSGRIVLAYMGTVSNEAAAFYYYVMWALIVVGVILIATSFRRKNSNGDERK